MLIYFMTLLLFVNTYFRKIREKKVTCLMSDTVQIFMLSGLLLEITAQRASSA